LRGHPGTFHLELLRERLAEDRGSTGRAGAPAETGQMQMGLSQMGPLSLCVMPANAMRNA